MINKSISSTETESRSSFNEHTNDNFKFLFIILISLSFFWCMVPISVQKYFSGFNVNRKSMQRACGVVHVVRFKGL